MKDNPSAPPLAGGHYAADPACDIRRLLQERLSAAQVKAIARACDSYPRLQAQLTQALLSTDRHARRQAAWVCSHTADATIRSLVPHADRLQQLALHTPEEPGEWLTLLLLHRLLPYLPFPAALYDFCLQALNDPRMPSGATARCLKIAADLSRPYPELRQELLQHVAIIPHERLTPALRSVLKRLSKETATAARRPQRS